MSIEMVEAIGKNILTPLMIFGVMVALCWEGRSKNKKDEDENE